MKKILTLTILGLIGFGIYTAIVETQIHKKIECAAMSFTPVSSNDVGKRTDNPKIVCADPIIDGNKECYDSRECIGACIIDKYSQDYENTTDFVSKNGPSKWGLCQPFKEMDCFVERKDGVVVMHNCP